MLEDIRERLNYIDTQKSELANIIDEYSEKTNYVRIEAQDNNCNRLFYTCKYPTPIEIRSKIGMIINELRACLDALACHLAVGNGRTTGDVYFPISKSKKIFEERGMRKIRKISKSDQQKIIDIKPYEGGNNILYHLHEADRKRKHIKLGTFLSNLRKSKFGEGASSIVIVGDGPTRIANLSIDNTLIAKNLWIDPSRMLGIAEGEEILFGENIPSSIPVTLHFSLSFFEPEEVYGVDAKGLIISAPDTIREILDKFS